MASRDLHVIHSSVAVSRIAPVETVPATDPFRILYVGALEPKKGVEHLLTALSQVGAQLGDWRLDAIGQGPSAEALKAQAASLGLAARVTFHGAKPFEEVASAYQQASVCVAPSVIGPNGRQEGIPNVMIKALAYQRPAITTAISGIPELIEDGVTGLLVPQADATALGETLLRGVPRSEGCAGDGEAGQGARRGGVRPRGECATAAGPVLRGLTERHAKPLPAREGLIYVLDPTRRTTYREV